MTSTGTPLAIPVSFAQERLWILDQLDPGMPTYNVPLAIELRGDGPVSLVAGALADLARRHEVLRTSFDLVDGEPMQLIWPDPDITLRTADLSGLGDDQRHREALRLASEEARIPFDLRESPLVRALLMTLGAGENILLVTVHHIISDLWSANVLLRDFGELYRARGLGREPDLPELPIQYADFAEWQRAHLQGATLERLTSFWRRQLADAPPEVTFPLDHPRPPAQTSNGGTLHFDVAGPVAERLERIAKHESATMFMVLLAAFDIVLGRYSGLADVTVGTPIANRTRGEIENLIGFFANTLVLRTRLDDDPTFRELVQRVKATTLDAYDHQDLPFEQLVAELETERDLSLGPLFQVLFGLNTTQVAEVAAHSDWGEITTGTAKFDATVLLRHTPDGLQGGFEYCTDLYEQATIERAIAYFRAILDAVSRRPEARVSEIAAAVSEPTAAERGFFRGPERHPRSLASPLAQFRAQVDRTPDALAVQTPRGTRTFRELAAEADRVAAVLRRYGARRGGRVGVCLPSSLELPGALVGALASGAAYVPLDPGYPRARLAYMIEDAALDVIIASTDTTPLVSGTAPIIVLDAADAADAGEVVSDLDGAGEEGAPVFDPDASDLAYLVYTSGSTGRPKGVAVSHEVLANLVDWQVRRSGPRPRTLQLAPLSFDVSLQEIFSTWAAGGALVLCDEALRTKPVELLALAREYEVERFFLSPALFQLLADIAPVEDWPPSLRELMVAGDRLRLTPAIREVLAARPDLLLLNHYGPSETHVMTEHDVVDTGEDLPPIGRPIQGATTYVLDADLRALPAGAVGQLFVGGCVLAQGYVGDPAMTADRFVPDPFAAAPGARMYRTGDLARFRPDGSIQFLGRVDHQLKIRGYRVEPAEVEAELERVAGVRSAVVVGHVLDGTTTLVGYVEPEADGSVDIGRLRAELRSRVPQWMVPERILVLDAFPLTPSGKVDRRALTGRALTPEPASPGATRPRSELEAALCEIWAEVLGVEAVGVHDSFFELGGHSLALTQVAARVRSRFGVDLALRTFFEAVTVEALSREIVLRALQQSGDDASAILDDEQVSAPAPVPNMTPAGA